MRRKINEENIRKIFKTGQSYAVTLPMEIVKELGWKERQKVVIKKRGSGFSIEDWKK